jgi:hypothetical protein
MDGALEIVPQTVDRFGRTVAEVYANRRNVGVTMVRQGMAYGYHAYLSGCDTRACPGLIQSVSQALLPRLRAWVEVGGMASSLCPKALPPQPIST